MLSIRRSDRRGRTVLGWLYSRHSFSFGDYVDPAHAGFGALRVLNEDRVAPGAGFGAHGHRNMEILTWVLSGALEHRDSTGAHGLIRPGDLQGMSAGTGVEHSELNHSRSEPVHFLQIWIEPGPRDLPPSYQQQSFPESERRGRLVRLAGPLDAADAGDVVVIQRDAELWNAVLAPGESVEHALRPRRRAWVQVARGAIRIGTERLETGDGAALSGETRVHIEAAEPSEVLLFDLA